MIDGKEEKQRERESFPTCGVSGCFLRYTQLTFYLRHFKLIGEAGVLSRVLVCWTSIKSWASFKLKLFKSVTKEVSITENVIPHVVGDQITLLKLGWGTSLTHMQSGLGGHVSLRTRTQASDRSEKSQSGESAAATPTTHHLPSHWSQSVCFFKQAELLWVDSSWKSLQFECTCTVTLEAMPKPVSCVYFIFVYMKNYSNFWLRWICYLNLRNHFKHIADFPLAIFLQFSERHRSADSLVVLANDF